MSFRRYLRALRLIGLDHHLLQWARRDVRVGYVGWVPRGNAGDEWIYEAHKHLIGSSNIRRLPIHQPGSQVVRVLRGRCQTILVGGGTVLGRDQWAKSLRSAEQAVPHTRLVVFGAGYHDPGHATAYGLGTELGQTEWLNILRRCSYVGLRGPRSVESVNRMGLTAEVVGDPVLAVPPEVLPSVELTGGIAVNLTNSTSATPDMHEWRRCVAQAVKHLSGRGHEITVFGMDSGDIGATCGHLAAAGLHTADIARRVNRRASIAQLIAGSDLVISERLHGAILAAALNRRFLHLGYSPKSWDFAESIGASHLLLSGNGASVLRVHDAIGDMDDRELDVAVGKEVAALRARFLRLHEEHI